MKLGRRVVLAVLGADGLAFLVLFTLAAIRRSADIVIPAYAVKWEMAQAVLSLLAWLPALQFLAVALAVGSQKGKAGDVFSASLLPGTVLSALLAGASLIMAPGYETSRYALESASARFNAALVATREALDRASPDEARPSFATLEALDRTDPRVMELRDRLLGAEMKAARSPSAKDAEKKSPANPAEAAKALASAKEYLRQRDYYSANWLAGRAFELNPSLAEAKRLRDQAWGEILAQGSAPEDAARATFFARKMEAFGRLRSGDVLGAYARFSQMAQEAPTDPDVKRYLAESLAAVEAEAFFRDEAEAAAESRIFPNFFALVPGKDGRQIALAATEVAFAPEVAFLMGAEYIELDKAGREILHVATPCAKLLEGRLILQSVERDRPDLVYPAVTDGPGTAPRSLSLGLDPLTAYRLAAGQRAASSASILDLYQGGSQARDFGMDEAPYFLELQKRLGLPFALFGASVLGILLGMALRYPGEKPSLGSWLALPIMALATGLGWQAIAGLDATFSRWILEVVQGPAALVLSGGIRFILLALLIILAAGLRHHGDSEPASV